MEKHANEILASMMEKKDYRELIVRWLTDDIPDDVLHSLSSADVRTQDRNDSSGLSDLIIENADCKIIFRNATYPYIASQIDEADNFTKLLLDKKYSKMFFLVLGDSDVVVESRKVQTAINTIKKKNKNIAFKLWSEIYEFFMEIESNTNSESFSQSSREYRHALVQEMKKNQIILTKDELRMMSHPKKIYTAFSFANKIITLTKNFLDYFIESENGKKLEAELLFLQKSSRLIGFNFHTKNNRWFIGYTMDARLPDEKHAFSLVCENDDLSVPNTYFPLSVETLISDTPEEIQDKFNKEVEAKILEIENMK